MTMRMNKILCRYMPTQHVEMNMILFTILLMLFYFLMPSRAQACCYPDYVANGFEGKFPWSACSTVEECEAPAQQGCTVTSGDYQGSTLYWRTCNGYPSVCSVLPDINCCAFGSNSACCINNWTDPCCDKPDDPCCGHENDPCCGNPDVCCEDKPENAEMTK